MVNSIGSGNSVHPDFGDNFGKPYVVVPGDQRKVHVSFGYESQSDPGPYPIPPNAPVEDGSDGHVLVVDRDNWKLYRTHLEREKRIVTAPREAELVERLIALTDRYRRQGDAFFARPGDPGRNEPMTPTGWRPRSLCRIRVNRHHRQHPELAGPADVAH